MPQGKTNNPQGKNQYTGKGRPDMVSTAGKVGRKVGGAFESASMTVKGAVKGAKVGIAAQSALDKPAKMINSKSGTNIKTSSIMDKAKAAYSGAKSGAKVGATAAKISPVGESKGEFKGREIGMKASNAMDKASSAASSAYKRLKAKVGK
jgi:hypothetical protein